MGEAGQQWVDGGGALQCAKRTLKHSCPAWHNTTLSEKKIERNKERESERGKHNAIVLYCIPIAKAVGEKWQLIAVTIWTLAGLTE